MPIDLDCSNTAPISLEEFEYRFRNLNISCDDEQGLVEAACLLSSLSKDKTVVNEYLKRLLTYDASHTDKNYELGFTAQVFPLRPLHNGHLLRAVVWPSKSDEFYVNTGSDLYYYGVPHNHNFHFLTVGYHGPGYTSEYYEIAEPTDGWHPGARVAPKFVGREQLSEEKVMLYRAHTDVHSQFPPEKTSISLNIIPASLGARFSRQFVFNSDVNEVSYFYQNEFNPIIFSFAAAMQSENVVNTLMDIYEKNPNPFIRYHALRAAASSFSNLGARLEILEKGLQSNSDLIIGWIQSYMNKIE
jgi:hypothetical protein